MKKISSIHCHQTEKAIIDALLKISEIIQKTENNRENQKSIHNHNKYSKLTIGDGDYNDNNQQQVPIPPPIRTLDSYITNFNQQNPSNCNQASIHKQQKQYSSKRCYSDTLSTSSSLNDYDRKKLSTHQSNKNLPLIYQEIEKKLTNPSTITMIDDDQLLSSLTKIPIEQQEKIHLSTLTKSNIEKLIDQLDSTKQTYNSDYYEKQCELGILAAKQGNYSLSYSIYTNLLYNKQYDYKLKSDILSSRATILLLDEKFYESIDDCNQAIALNQWNKLAYIIRATCWMIKHEYFKAVNDYSKLFHFFDQSQEILDLLNIAYEKYQSLNHIEEEDENHFD